MPTTCRKQQWGDNAVKLKLATALILSLALVDHAMAGWFNIVPKPVPEFDGSTGVAAIALLVSVLAVVFNRRRSDN